MGSIHSVSISKSEWDLDQNLHLILICINIAFLIFLMVRFEWQFVLRLFRPCLNQSTDRRQQLLRDRSACDIKSTSSRTNGPHFNTVASKSSNERNPSMNPEDIHSSIQSQSGGSSRKNTTTAITMTMTTTNNDTAISTASLQPHPMADHDQPDLEEIVHDLDPKAIFDSLDVSSGANTTTTSGSSFNKSGSNTTASILNSTPNDHDTDNRNALKISDDHHHTQHHPVHALNDQDSTNAASTVLPTESTQTHGKFPSSHSSTVIDVEEAAKRPLKPKHVRPLSITTGGIELVKVTTASTTAIEDEKDIIHYPNEPVTDRVIEEEDDTPDLGVTSSLVETCRQGISQSQRPSTPTRHRKSIEFYKELFNPNNYDDDGNYISTTNDDPKWSKKRKRRGHKYRNSDAEDLENQLLDNPHPDDDIAAEPSPQIRFTADYAAFHNDHGHEEEEEEHRVFKPSESKLSLRSLLDSTIHDDAEKKSVRYRYRYILYVPLSIHVVFGMVCYIATLLDAMNEPYRWMLYGYPVLQWVLSIVLWSQIDIVILSCGGSSIVEECLEVQISANGHEYRCVYCCCCNCSALGFCNSCTHDNGYSLFKCHHKFMKILLCVICPLLVMVLWIISEPQLGLLQFLVSTELQDLKASSSSSSSSSSSPNGKGSTTELGDKLAVLPLYDLVFFMVSSLYIILLVTATWIGARLVQSLHFVSSMSSRKLTRQYLTSIAVTLVMQLQFMILLVGVNLVTHSSSSEDTEEGLSAAMAFYMLLVYVEFIGVNAINVWSFQRTDFIEFGTEAIKPNEVQLFEFEPPFDEIHDLHNYRRVLGEDFWSDLDAQEIHQIDSSVDSDSTLNDDQNEKESHLKAQKTLRKKAMGTPLITNGGVRYVNDEGLGRPTSTRHRNKHNHKYHRQSSKGLLEPDHLDKQLDIMPIASPESSPNSDGKGDILKTPKIKHRKHHPTASQSELSVSASPKKLENELSLEEDSMDSDHDSESSSDDDDDEEDSSSSSTSSEESQESVSSKTRRKQKRRNAKKKSMKSNEAKSKEKESEENTHHKTKSNNTVKTHNSWASSASSKEPEL